MKILDENLGPSLNKRKYDDKCSLDPDKLTVSKIDTFLSDPDKAMFQPMITQLMMVTMTIAP